ncbi:MAG: hypothetical protein EOP38_00320 [Rubrivivax sp.]|nr:MAG: hypothetical protein EOP38_00320 [Rubrivivax sp.]
MSISQSDLLNASRRASIQKRQITANAGQSTAFLSHSHLDRNLAEGLQILLKEQGWDLYIDWQDTTMPDTPDRQTAQNIQSRIKSCSSSSGGLAIFPAGASNGGRYVKSLY